MTSQWYYIPVSIRLVSDNEVYALSGVNLVLRGSNGTVLYETTISVSHIPRISWNDFEIYVTTSCLSVGDNLHWHTALPSFHVPLVERKDEELYKYLNFFKENGFKLVPNDTVSGNTLMSLNLIGIRLISSTLSKIVKRDMYNLVEYTDSEATTPITIKSCPFSFTNPLLFGDFQSSGSVNLRIRKNDETLGYLSDVPYLENMVGGIVHISKTPKSLGLVMGNLRKLNGDGDLIFILSWEVIWRLLSKKFPNFPMRLTFGSSKSIRNPSSVLPVVVSEKARLFWGSCIYYNHSTLVTNNHVISAYIDRPGSVSCKIFLTKDRTITLTNKDIVITPHEQLDLSFIKLSPTNQELLHSMENIIPIEYDYFYKAGDQVTTVGYGLYFNNLQVEPLESVGHISAKYSLPLYKDDHGLMPCIIVTSASCWNGSSGGGLFKKSMNKLVGLICSNAQVISPAFDDEKNEKETEKLSKMVLCIPIEVINRCYHDLNNPRKLELDDRIGHTWTLIPYHNDVVVSKPKL